MSWSGGDDQWVWAITTGAADEFSDNQFHHVYWSKDYGKTMVDRFPEIQRLVQGQPGGSVDPTLDNLHASVRLVLVHAADPKKVILWGEGKFLFISDNAGESFGVYPMPKDTFGMSHLTRPHPTQPDWLLSMAYRNSCYEDEVFAECAMDLWLSKDFGKNWENLTLKTKGKLAGFIDFDWGYHTADPKYQKLFKETTIIATAHTQVYRSAMDIRAEDISLFRSDDDFQNFEKLASCGAAFELIAGQVCLPTRSLFLSLHLHSTRRSRSLCTHTALQTGCPIASPMRCCTEAHSDLAAYAQSGRTGPALLAAAAGK